jgi:hypothetical protein
LHGRPLKLDGSGAKNPDLANLPSDKILLSQNIVSPWQEMLRNRGSLPHSFEELWRHVIVKCQPSGFMSMLKKGK